VVIAANDWKTFQSLFQIIVLGIGSLCIIGLGADQLECADLL
jgi:hypothetical protein